MLIFEAKTQNNTYKIKSRQNKKSRKYIDQFIFYSVAYNKINLTFVKQIKT